jgi:hypothetical protein
LAAVVLVTPACSGDSGNAGGKNGDRGGGTGAGSPPAKAPGAAVPLPGPVELPEKSAELGAVIARQVQAATWVRASVTYTASAGAGETVARLDARMRTSPGPTEALLTAVDTEDGKRSTTQAIMTGGLYFTRVEGQDQVKGKPWLRLSHTELNNAQLGPFTTIFTGVLTKLENEIKKMSADSGTELVGRGSFKGSPAEDTVDGVKVRRYKGTTDTEKMAEADPDYSKMAGLGLKEIPWTLWLADNGLPYRFEATIGRGDTTVDASTSYSGWGQPVTIKPPPPAQVATVADMTRG